MSNNMYVLMTSPILGNEYKKWTVVKGGTDTQTHKHTNTHMSTYVHTYVLVQPTPPIRTQ